MDLKIDFSEVIDKIEMLFERFSNKKEIIHVVFDQIYDSETKTSVEILPFRIEKNLIPRAGDVLSGLEIKSLSKDKFGYSIKKFVDVKVLEPVISYTDDSDFNTGCYQTIDSVTLKVNRV